MDRDCQSEGAVTVDVIRCFAKTAASDPDGAFGVIDGFGKNKGDHWWINIAASVPIDLMAVRFVGI